MHCQQFREIIERCSKDRSDPSIAECAAIRRHDFECRECWRWFEIQLRMACAVQGISVQEAYAATAADRARIAAAIDADAEAKEG
jgi:hypothetical protein